MQAFRICGGFRFYFCFSLFKRLPINKFGIVGNEIVGNEIVGNGIVGNGIVGIFNKKGSGNGGGSKEFWMNWLWFKPVDSDNFMVYSRLGGGLRIGKVKDDWDYCLA